MSVPTVENRDDTGGHPLCEMLPVEHCRRCQSLSIGSTEICTAVLRAAYCTTIDTQSRESHVLINPRTASHFTLSYKVSYDVLCSMFFSPWAIATLECSPSNVCTHDMTSGRSSGGTSLHQAKTRRAEPVCPPHLSLRLHLLVIVLYPSGRTLPLLLAEKCQTGVMLRRCCSCGEFVRTRISHISGIASRAKNVPHHMRTGPVSCSWTNFKFQSPSRGL